jgi:outer membrane protein assembly factor BamB
VPAVYDVAALRIPPVSIRALAAAVLLLAIPTGGAAIAQVPSDWSEFQGGPTKSGASAEGPAPAYVESWELAVAPGGPGSRFGLSAPVVAGDVAIAVGPEQVIAVDVATGEEAFSVDRELGPSVPGAVATIDGTRSFVYTQGWGDGPPEPGATDAPTGPTPTPDAAGGEGTEPVGSELASFDLETREPSWPPVPLGAISRTGVTVDGGRAFVGTNDGSVAGVDIATGSLAWQRDLGAPLVTSLAASEGLVIAALQGDRDTAPVVVGLDLASGDERWRHEAAGGATIVSAPSVSAGRVHVVFTGLSETAVVALDLSSGEERWSRRVSSAFDVVAPPVVAGGSVYVTDPRGQTRAIDAATGEERWDFAMNAVVLRTVPALIGDHLLVPASDGELGAIEVETGELVWRGPSDGSPLRFLAPARDKLIGVRGGEGSGFVAFEHDPRVALVREASPTTLAPGRMLGAFAAAAIPLLALVLLLGRALRPRMGTAFPEAPEGEDDEEPVHDPWEDDEGPAT